MSTRLRRGFTLIELLVVIAIIAILVALLLPAVQQVREAARKSQCQDHLHNIAVALANYEGSLGIFPPGVIPPIGAPTTQATARYDGWAWGAFLLPFIEQKPTYDLANLGRGEPMGLHLDDACDVDIAMYRCPSDTGPEKNDKHWGAGDGTPTISPANAIAMSNYVAMHAHRQHDSINWNLIRSDDNANFSGAFGLMSNRRMRDIMDGPSQVIAVSERAYMLSGVTMYAAVWAGCVRSNHDDCIDEVLGALRAPINATTFGKNERQQSISSQHPGGVQAVLFDGQVRFLSENIDFVMNGTSNTSAIDSVLERLVGIQDAQVVGSF